jgi:ketopantoate reductase
MIGSAEPSPGHIVQDEGDKLLVGAFPTSNINPAVPERRAEEFVDIYSKGGKTNCHYSPNVLHDRWKKLVFNACLNPICAITGLDDGRLRLADGALDGLVRPAMREIVAAAKAVCGVELPEDVVEATVNADPLESYLKPSMQQDLEKVRFPSQLLRSLGGWCRCLICAGQLPRVREPTRRAATGGEGCWCCYANARGTV